MPIGLEIFKYTMDPEILKRDPFKCTKCSYSCKLSQNLMTHMKTHRKGQALLHCDMCSYVASNKLQLARHRNSSCLKRLPLTSQKTLILETNNNEPTFLLQSVSNKHEDAPRIISINGKLAQVELVHFETTPASESSQDQAMTTPPDLNAEREKSFRNRINPWSEKKEGVDSKRSHASRMSDASENSQAQESSDAGGTSGKEDNEPMPDIKGFQCSLCSKSYSCLDGLSIHMISHNKNKSFKCPKCTYRSSQAGGLYSHLKTHSGAILFPCDQCQFESPSAKKLTRHRNQFHDVMKAHGVSLQGQIEQKSSSSLITSKKPNEQITATCGGKLPEVGVPKFPVGTIPKSSSMFPMLPFVSIEKLPMSSISKLMASGRKSPINILKVESASMPSNTPKMETSWSLSPTTDLKAVEKVSDASKLPTVLTIQKVVKVSTASALPNAPMPPNYFELSAATKGPTPPTVKIPTVVPAIVPTASTIQTATHDQSNVGLHKKLTSTSVSKQNSVLRSQFGSTKWPKASPTLIFSCPYCIKVFTSRQSLEIHIRIHTGEKPYQCNRCNYSCSQKGNLRSHLRRHRMDRKEFKCAICGYATSTTFQMNAHYKNQHKVSDSNAKPESPLSSSVNVTKPTGGSSSSNVVDQIVPSTPEISALKQNPESGIQRQQLDEKVVVTLKVEPASEASKETIQEIKIRSYRCQLCNFVSKFQIGLNKHLLKVHHHRNETLQPKVQAPLKHPLAADNRFQNKFIDVEPDDQYDKEPDVDPLAILEIPQEEEPPEQNTKALMCPLCQQSFPREFLLDIHMRTHMLIPSPPAPIRSGDIATSSSAVITTSNFTINNVWSLQSHKEQPNFVTPAEPAKSPIPQGISRFHCPYCYKNLGSNQSLAIHIRVHTGEKPYHCNLCSYSTNQQINLKTHMRSHRNGLIFKCKFCNFTSSNIMTVNVHNNQKHGNGIIKKVKCIHPPNPVLSTLPEGKNGWSSGFGSQAESKEVISIYEDDNEWNPTTISKIWEEKQSLQEQPKQIPQQQQRPQQTHQVQQPKQAHHLQQQNRAQQLEQQSRVQQLQQQDRAQQLEQHSRVQQLQQQNRAQQLQQQSRAQQLQQPVQIHHLQGSNQIHQLQKMPNQLQHPKPIHQQQDQRQIYQQQQQKPMRQQQRQIHQYQQQNLQQLQQQRQLLSLQRQRQILQQQQQKQRHILQLQQQKQIHELQQQKQNQEPQQHKQNQEPQQHKQNQELQQQKQNQELQQLKQNQELQQQKQNHELQQQKQNHELQQLKQNQELQQQKQNHELQQLKQNQELQQQKQNHELQQHKQNQELQQQKQNHELQQHKQNQELQQQKQNHDKLQQQKQNHDQIKTQILIHQLHQSKQIPQFQQQRHIIHLQQPQQKFTNMIASVNPISQSNVQSAVVTSQFNQSFIFPSLTQIKPGVLKPFACTYCARRFRQKNQLVSHTRIHTGEKPYKCKECDYATSHQQSLIIHLRRHTGERPYTCHICGHTTASLPALYIHRKRHAKPFKCRYCPRESCDKAVIERHQVRHFTSELQL